MVYSRTSARAVATKALHDAFISYSRKDREFARALEKALERFRPPKDLPLPQRHLDVFRDEDDFTGVSYNESVARHLQASATLIVICSPDAASSPYVEDEIRRFAQDDPERRDRIIPILYRGVPNNEAEPGCEAERAFPKGLCDLLGMPLAVDYREFHPREYKPNTGIFSGAWFTLLANLYGISRAQIEERERRTRARTLRIWIAVAAAIVTLLSVALVLTLVSRHQAVLNRQKAEQATKTAEAEAVALSKANADLIQANHEKEVQRSIAVQQKEEAVKQRDIAEERRKVAISRLLAEQAADRVRVRPDEALLLAVEANRIAQTAEARSNLFALLQQSAGIRTYLHDHKTAVLGLAYSRDGTKLATAGKDNLVVLWDLTADSSTSRPLIGHNAEVRTVDFSPDGKILASGARDGMVILWNVETGQRLIPPIDMHAGPIWHLAFSPNGRVLAIGGDQGLVLWNFELPTVSRHIVRGYSGWVDSVAFSHDGRLLAFAGHDGVMVSDASLEGSPRSFPCKGEGAGLSTVAFDRDNSALFASCGRRVLRWKLSATTASGQEVAIIKGSILSFAISPDTKTMALGGMDGLLTFWNIEEGKAIGEPFSGGPGWLMAVAFSPDGRTLVSGWGNSRTIVHEAREVHVFSSLLAGHYRPVFDQHHGILATVSRSRSDGKAKVTLWRGRPNWTVWREIGTPSESLAVEFAPNSSTLAVGISTNRDEPSKVLVWKLETGRPSAKPMSSPSWANALAFSPDGHTLAAAGGAPAFSNYGIRLWDYETNRLPKDLPSEHQGPVTHLSFVGDNRTLVSRGGETFLWNTRTCTRKATPWNSVARGGVIWNSNASVFAWISNDRHLHVWIPAKNRISSTSQTVLGTVAAVSFTGRIIAVTGSDGLSLFEASSLRRIGAPQPVEGGAESVDFSPDDGLVATSSRGKGVAIWDVPTRRPFWLLHLDSALNYAPIVHFGPDSKSLAVTDDHGTTIWDLDIQSWTKKACSIANRNLSQIEWKQFLGSELPRKTCESLPLYSE